MSPRHDSQYRPPPDKYAAHRCLCNHLVYANQLPGDPCILCACIDHAPASQQEARS